MFLLAAESGIADTLFLLGGIAAILVMSIAPFAWWHSREESKWRKEMHAERMRAIELGIWPGKRPDRKGANHKEKAQAHVVATAGVVAKANGEDENSLAELAKKCYSIAGWTPFWAFLFNSWVGTRSVPVAIVVALAVAAISCTGIACGTWLAGKAHSSLDPYAGYTPTMKPPAFDPDSFDVVASRG
jgi:hypothetical protein